MILQQKTKLSPDSHRGITTTQTQNKAGFPAIIVYENSN